MSDMLRKLNSLSRRANAKNRELILEVDLILDQSNPKYSWDDETWEQYINFEKQRGNKVLYLCGQLEQQQKENIQQYEQLEFEFKELEALEQMEHE